MTAKILAAAVGTLFLAACTSQPPATPPTLASQMDKREVGPYTFVKGYLDDDQFVDDLALLPAPPAAGSAAFAADEQAYETLSALQGSARGELARQDADLNFPASSATFSCALGVDISEEDTPNIYTLLYRTMSDAGKASPKSKAHYNRTRPFVAHDTDTCLPEHDRFLRGNGSYPSGHSTIGWTWALMLSQVAPDRADALLQRGRAFAQSRAICGAHWKSDVEYGRLLGASVITRLQDSSAYQQQLALARDEVAQALAAGHTPDSARCDAEAEALQDSAPLAP